MKYIRTKDGKIFDLERFEDKTTPVGKAVGLITLIDKNKICDYEIFKKDIINQADTIEELCDEFVGFDDSSKLKIFFAHYKLARECKEEREKNNEKIKLYGAIWTDKGLIYVAKTNDRGELELI